MSRKMIDVIIRDGTPHIIMDMMDYADLCDIKRLAGELVSQDVVNKGGLMFVPPAFAKKWKQLKRALTAPVEPGAGAESE